MVGGGNIFIDDGEALHFRLPEKGADSCGLTDYKIYCFNGVARLMMVATNRYSNDQTRFDYFDRDGNWLDLVWGNPRSEAQPVQPPLFQDMFVLAEKLAEGTIHVRIDFYVIGKQIYFGEITFFDGSGMTKMEPDHWDYDIGAWLDLPINNKE